MTRRISKRFGEFAARGGIVILFLVLGLFLTAGTCMAQAEEKEKAAVAAAEKWLGTVDEGKYAESWDQAAELFRNAVTKDSWLQSLNGIRKPLGGLVSRKVTENSYSTTLPGAPDGEYVVIHFGTTFANKKSALETVTATLEKDGNWKISGYIIR